MVSSRLPNLIGHHHHHCCCCCCSFNDCLSVSDDLIWPSYQAASASYCQQCSQPGSQHLLKQFICQLNQHIRRVDWWNRYGIHFYLHSKTLYISDQIGSYRLVNSSITNLSRCEPAGQSWESNPQPVPCWFPSPAGPRWYHPTPMIFHVFFLMIDIYHITMVVVNNGGWLLWLLFVTSSNIFQRLLEWSC